MKPDKSNILIILPAFNEGEVIGNVLSEVQNAGYSQICVIDDGSEDNTSEISHNYGVKVLKHPINRGPGAAIQTGIQYAKFMGYPYAILMDSDGQHLPEDIDNLYNRMIETEADIVIGSRFFTDNNIPKHRIAYNKIANVLTNFFCKNTYSDTQSGFRLLNRKAIESLKLKNRGFSFCSEMLFVGEKLNLKIEQTPIRVIYTEYSLNKGQNLKEGVRTARSILWRVFVE